MLQQSNQHFFPQGFLAPFYVDTLFPWELLDNMRTTLQHLKGSIHSQISPHAYLENTHQIVIEQEVTIEAGAYVRGPCFIGRGSVIRHGAYLRGDIWIGENSVVGHASELKNVLVGSHSVLAHFVYAADSVIGSHVNLASHVTLANLRLDGKNVLPMQKGKFGSVIGDYAKIGCHVVLNPGTQILPETKIYLKQQLQTL
jgi:NDP-sugar pyrophosphorylase family protein